MTIGGIGANTRRINDGNNEKAAEAKSSKPARGAAPKMNLDDAAKASERHAARPNFGALGKAPSMEDQYRNAIAESKAEGRAMAALQRQAVVAHDALPKLSRGAELITAVGSGVATVQNLAVSAVESLVTADTHPIARAADDAAFSGGLVFGELSDKIDAAKDVYRSFESQYAQYADVNRQYQHALNNQDHQAITSLAERKQQLKSAIQQTVARFERAVRGVGKADNRFEAATVHAAEHLVASAIGAGVSGASTRASHGFVKDLVHNAEHMAVETAVTRTGQNTVRGH